MALNKRILITTGDQDGIGPEVTLKALDRIQISGEQLFVWIGQKSMNEFQSQLSPKFSTKVIVNECSYESLVDMQWDSSPQIYLLSGSSPAHWVETSARLCMTNAFHGLVTAPLSKGLILKAGFKDIGHTQILKRVSGAKDVFMFFIGKHFNVLLMTDHIPLTEVSRSLSSQLLKSAIQCSIGALKYIDAEKAKKPIRVVGFNPHAGEAGLLGNEELEIFNSVIADYTSKNILGPEVPDAAFLKADDTSIFICSYHDQGLIPFKFAHRHHSIHTSLGLPFPRTSVDHGTAKDIFGKDKADSTSMYYAIKLMQQYLNKERFLL